MSECFWCPGESDEELSVRARYGEGLTIHSGSESSAVIREGVCEALTGVCIGQPLNREGFVLFECFRCYKE